MHIRQYAIPLECRVKVYFVNCLIQIGEKL